MLRGIYGMSFNRLSTKRWVWKNYLSVAFLVACVLFLVRVLMGEFPPNVLSHVYVLGASDGYLLLFFTACLVLHAMMAMEVIIEDYVHYPYVRRGLIWGVRLLCLVMGGGACLNILSITAFL